MVTETEIDYRKNQRVIATLELEDKWQDFTELDVLENGVILWNSIMFKDWRLSIVWIYDQDYIDRIDWCQLADKEMRKHIWIERLCLIRMQDTNHDYSKHEEPMFLTYKITWISEPEKPNRFIELSWTKASKIFRMLVASSEWCVIVVKDDESKNTMLQDIKQFKVQFIDMYKSLWMIDPKVVTFDEISPQNKPEVFIDEALCFFTIK